MKRRVQQFNKRLSKLVFHFPSTVQQHCASSLSLSLSLEFLSLYKTTTLSSQYDTSTTLYNLYILLCSLLHRELITFSILSLTLSLSLSRSKTKTGKLRLSIFSSFLKRCRFCFILTHSFIFRMTQ